MQALNLLTLRTKLFWLVALAVIMVFLVGIASLLQQREVMLSDHRDRVRAQTEVANSLIQNYEKLAASGQMSESQAQAAAAAALTAIRYDDGNYFFVFDAGLQHYLVLGPRPALVGTDPHLTRDGLGRNFGDLFSQALRQGGGKGYVSYVWPKAGSDRAQPKVSYLMTSPRWGWHVGTGMYVDDVNRIFYQNLWRFAAEVTLVLLLLAGLATVGWMLYVFYRPAATRGASF